MKKRIFIFFIIIILGGYGFNLLKSIKESRNKNILKESFITKNGKTIFEDKTGLVRLTYGAGEWEKISSKVFENETNQIDFQHKIHEMNFSLLIEPVGSSIYKEKETLMETMKQFGKPEVKEEEYLELKSGEKILRMVFDIKEERNMTRTLYLYWQGERGAVAVFIGTKKKLFEKYKKEIYELADGFEIIGINEKILK